MNADAYVVVSKGKPQMCYRGNILKGDNAPDMLVTHQGEVFTRQSTAQTREGKDIQVVANVKGLSIAPKSSEYLKGAWHIPHIPTAMDVVGR
jgi:hypothetical protein